MKKLIKIVGVIFFLLFVFFISTITWVDRTPYAQKEFYGQMNKTLDSLDRYFPALDTGILQVGWSKVDIVPYDTLPLAGYGARDPKEFTAIHDSVFIKTFVLKNAGSKKALLSAELLVIHPEVTRAFYKRLNHTSWKPSDIYLMATHTHSSLGAWAPGFVGNLFAGEYDTETVNWLAEKMFLSLQSAASGLDTGRIGYSALSLPDFVKNRLVKDRGEIDPWMKLLYFSSDSLNALHGVYSAHATCLNQKFTELSGDFPSAFMSRVVTDSIIHFASYSAGAVASMGPADTETRQWEKAREIGYGIAEQVSFLSRLGIPKSPRVAMRSFHVPIALREPNFKVSGELRVRPWIFYRLFGDYPANISVLQLNNVLMIGLPCDFSGELALPLYEYAESKGLNLILTSFNGGYIGYIPHDKWYDLNKYETRTMAWYGFDNGAYVSEIVKRLIDLSSR